MLVIDLLASSFSLFNLPSLWEGLGVGFSVFFVLLFLFFVRHQRSLRQRAYLMREAIRNRDWSFRLNTKGLTSGERAMQEVMNDLGEIIHQQVNQREVESWERLTRVLTHEIMNSTAPIASISQSLLRRDDVVGTPLEAGIRSIHATATRLTTFVESYRKLAQLQQPKPEDVRLETFFAEVQRLYPQLTWDVVGMDEVIVHTDPVLLQQVVVNLVKNAVEAGARRIKAGFPSALPVLERFSVSSSRSREEAVTFANERDCSPKHSAPSLKGRAGGESLLISNDGAPIPAADRDSIFIPFFTTKHRGTGIGLALSRQIMVRQGGDLELMDQPETGYTVTFRLSFT